MPLTANSILAQLPAAPHYWVAYSGGVDSHTLLHLLFSLQSHLPGKVGAVHVDHGIQSASGDWAAHCRAVCVELDVPFIALRTDARAQAGQSPEQAAREARYRVLADWLAAGDVVLTAQHQDDQAETLLLQLFRGAGPRGLAAMPASADLGKGRLLRPLLSASREQILGYASQHALQWVEDPSNTDLRYDRNFLRRQLWPELQQRWRGLSSVLARAAGLQADQAELARALADIDLQQCFFEQSDDLSLTAIAACSAARQRNLLRRWIEGRGFRLPSRVLIERIRREVIYSRVDASPLVQWQGAEIRRYRQRIYLMSPLSAHDENLIAMWELDKVLHLPSVQRTLAATRVTGQGLHLDAPATVQVRFRQGGETLQPVGRGQRHSLKHLFQEWAIPEWERPRVPLLYRDDQLIAVAGYCVCEGCQARSGQSGYIFNLNPMV